MFFSSKTKKVDMETFIKWERNMLREERQRLSKTNENEESKSKIIQNACPADVLIKENNAFNCVCIKSKEGKNATSGSIEKIADSAQSHSSKMQPIATTNALSQKSSMTTVLPNLYLRNLEQMPAIERNPVGLSNETFALYAHHDSNQENENACRVEITKSDKDLANQQAAAYYVNNMTVGSTNVSPTANRDYERGKKDDMEQWVTDTFYSYFPGFNDELQKRQRYLRERQQENQQNLIKHQLNHPPLPKNALHRGMRYDPSHQTVNTARSASTTTSATTNTNSSTMSTHPTDKTDLEIIVNNPGYVPPKQHTPRNKLLQDLRHTELSNIIGGDGVTDRNRYTAELESERKKDYQRDLMQQIEEKRRSIEILREKERRHEEALTRRLQEQLKTIHLEEELEKEKIRADKARFDNEQSRLMREHLLAKLESDTKLLYAKSKNREFEVKSFEPQRAAKAPGTATTADIGAMADASENNNKVYKYFSNSARHEYRRGKLLPEELELDLNIATLNEVRSSDELECFHLSEKVCPMCDAPLKSYESCCMRCQKQLSIRVHARNKGNRAERDKTNKNELSPPQNQDNLAEGGITTIETESYSMVCEKCERLYGLCPTCLAQNDVCKACHRKRNVCMECRRTLCTRCLDEIASGRDTEHNHINESDNVQSRPLNKNEVDSVRSFRVLEVNYGTAADDNKNGAPTCISPWRNVINEDNVYNEGAVDSLLTPRPPYSMSIERNSIFHPDYNSVKQTTSFDKSDSTPGDELFNIERVRKDNDNRLSRYLRNYGDLAGNPRTRSRSDSGQDRSTQTTPNTAARRDVVIHEEHNLSMPLLREMPKMTRSESNHHPKRPIQVINNRIEQLKRRWEIPAVQKFTISSTKPKVLTQVGAIRKQLQAEHILQDALDDNH